MTPGLRAAPPVPDLPGASGRLRVVRFGSSPGAGESARFVARFVNGPDYAGMTDNDLRGCLDGTFLWGWNQATQTHVRLGRMPWPGTPKYGEVELFRVLQRWADIGLPAPSRIAACRLELDVEKAPPFPVRLLLYAVNRDWGPGRGGIDRNNVSPPARGEAWWLEARHELERWALPGAGHASDSHPDADTQATPLAQAVCTPDAATVRFEGEALAAYVGARIEAGAPLLLMVKVADVQEDVPGAFLSLYSGEYGDSRSTAKRPRLVVEWEAAAGVAVLDRAVALEHGRTLELPRFAVEPGDRLIAAFDCAPGFEEPLVEARVGAAGRAGPWRRVGHGLGLDGEWAQVRVRAVTNPVELGAAFTAAITDTWVPAGPAEDQVVGWVFTSPTGVQHETRAAYDGGFRWTVRFEPDEPGPWTYRWAHAFAGEPVEGATGRFDVVASDPAAIGARLERLAREANGTRARKDEEEAARLRIVFSRLERAAMALEAPAAFRAAGGPALAAELRLARSALWGKPVPDPIPLEAHPVITVIKGRRLRAPILDGKAHGLGPGQMDGRAGRWTRRVSRFVARAAGALRRLAHPGVAGRIGG